MTATSVALPGAAAAAPTTETVDVPLQGARQAAVSIRFGAGQLSVGPELASTPGQLASMTFTGPADQVPAPSFSVVGDTGRLDFAGSGRGTVMGPFGNSAATTNLEINLNRDVPITSLNVQAGATDARLDLSSLRVNNVDMAVGAAQTWVRMPESGQTAAHISGGASKITIEIPPNVAARIRHSGGLSGLQVDRSRFPAQGEDVNQSPDWETAQNRVDITVETGLTTIQVN